ncbi:hypothetical protein ABH909_000329 [Pseudomonas sp. BS3782 TE3695]|uniref:fibronectin type III domain-containing protein n=1 Tax=Pseudomonas sp. BS3782 TE3695 TaxID=3349323 RepID=UPI003D1FD23B
MNNDSVDTTDNLEGVSDDTASDTNYSRWMTDMVGIEEMKLYQLAIPGAHNSGVDQQGTWGLEERMAACQLNSFIGQLMAGTRYLDLRLEDKSYWKMVGNFAPQRVLVESFEFTHGNDSFWYSNVSAGRTLEDLIFRTLAFSSMNPGEIIILNIRKFKKPMIDSLERVFPYLTPIKNLLIPKSARNLTIGEIRLNYPGRNIILSFDHGSPKNWKSEWVQKDDLWPAFSYLWSPDDSEKNIEKLVIETMLSPPRDNYWVLSAACRNTLGPLHLPVDHPVRTEVFKPGHQNACIVMVDFIEKQETITSVVDPCIALSKQRISNLPPPSPPTNFTAKQLNGENQQNTVEFNWERGTDGIGVRTYEIYEGDNLLITTNDVPHREKNLPRKNYTLKIRAVNATGKYSEFSRPFTLVQDVTPPTAPENFRFTKAGLRLAELAWDPCFDEAGIAHYEISVDGRAPTTTIETAHKASDLIASRTHTFRVRAKDINGFYSEYTDLVLHPRPEKLENPKFEIENIIPGLPAYIISIKWDLVENAQDRMSYHTTVNSIDFKEQVHEDGVLPNRTLLAIPGIPTKVESNILFATAERTDNSTFQFIFEPEPPLPIRNLTVQSRTPAATLISWTYSSSPNILNYAISINKEPPILVSKSTSTYTFEEMPVDEQFLIEIWAIKDFDICSTVESLTIEPIDITPPSKPGIPVITDITSTTAAAQWTTASDNIAVAGYKITLNNNAPFTVTDNKHVFAQLTEATLYTIEIRAIDTAGNLSDPATSSFRTKEPLMANQPRDLRVTSNANKTVAIAWDAPLEGNGLIGYTVDILGKTTNVGGMTHTMFNLLPYLPLRIGVLARYENNVNSDLVYITVVPNP